MIRWAGAYVILGALAAPPAGWAQQPEPELFKRCATAPLGSAECDSTELAEALGQLSARDMRIFGDAGMESFAMLTALRYGASAIYFAAEGDGCIAEEERAAAIDIWSVWVRPPEGLSQTVRAQYETYAGVIDAIIDMEVGC